LTVKIARHIIKHKWRRTPRFALVLQLEPLHTCNLTCTGCGRIREYSTSLKDMMSLEDCLASARECDAPMVSICGGEPLIYPQIKELVAGLLAQRRIVYICTNGLLMRRELKDYLAGTYSPAREPVLARLLAEKLISPKDAEIIRQGKTGGRPVIQPTQWLYWNVHVDGPEYAHDRGVEREGVFQECVAAVRMAKLLGFQVATNTTVYKEADMGEIELMFKFFSALGVDGHTISPGYDFDAAKTDMVKRLGKKPEDFFSDPRHDATEIRPHSRMEPAVQHFRHAGLSGIFGRPARTDLHAVGHSHPQYPGLESAVLPHDRRPLSELPRDAGKGGLEQIRRGGWRGARPAVRALHGSLRLRSQRRLGHQLPARRQLEKFQIQFRSPAQTVSVLAGTGTTRLQRRVHRPGPSRPGQDRPVHGAPRMSEDNSIFELVVLSGKGGTGKTSVTASLAALAEKPALADCDVDASNLELLLEPRPRRRATFSGGLRARIKPGHCTACGKCEELCRFDAIFFDGPGNGRVPRTFRVDPLACEGCGVCAHFCADHAIEMVPTDGGEWFVSDTRFGPLVHARLRPGQGNSGKLAALVREQARTAAREAGRRLILIDGPPGVGCQVMASLTGASMLLAVTEPTPSGEHDLERVLALAGHFEIPAFVCMNKHDLNPALTARIERRAAELGATVAGRIPYDPSVTAAQRRGRPVVEYDPKSPAAQAIIQLWNNLAANFTNPVSAHFQPVSAR
jgi:MinD superfamily P-loop ATPase